MSNYGRELTGIIPQKQEVKEDDKKDEKEDDSSKSETISTKEENKSNDDVIKFYELNIKIC